MYILYTTYFIGTLYPAVTQILECWREAEARMGAGKDTQVVRGPSGRKVVQTVPLRAVKGMSPEGFCGRRLAGPHKLLPRKQRVRRSWRHKLGPTLRHVTSVHVTQAQGSAAFVAPGMPPREQ